MSETIAPMEMVVPGPDESFAGSVLTTRFLPRLLLGFVPAVLTVTADQLEVAPGNWFAQLAFSSAGAHRDEITSVLVGNELATTEVRLKPTPQGFQRVAALHVRDPRRVSDALEALGYPVVHGSSWDRSPPSLTRPERISMPPIRLKWVATRFAASIAALLVIVIVIGVIASLFSS